MEPEQLGPYRILRLLGRGGMGAVYEGINDETDEPAAVKVLPAALAVEPDFRQRFSVEIEALRKLYHPNIVQLFGFGEQDGILFYAMELVQGSNLEQELRQGRRFDWREAAEIGIQTCRALRHAHDRGIIHRDIKPANLMWTPDRRVKLSDFGIARLFGNTKLTVVGSVLGTAEYMAPEQADARPTGPRTDLYSLGGVLYCLLARRPPFVARSLPEMIEKHRSAVPDPVGRHAPDCPAEFEAIVAQLLEKTPEARIPNATLVARRLEAVLAAMSVQPTTAEHKLLRSLRESPRSQPPPDPAKTPEPDGIAPTVAADDSRFVGGGQAVGSLVAFAATSRQELPVVSPATASPSNDLPATGATSTYVRPGAAGTDAAQETRLATAPSEAHSLDASDRDAWLGDPTAGKPPKRFGGTFVAIGEKDLDPVEPEPPPHAALTSLQTWLLAGSLLAMGLTAWYMLQPATRDDLYARICTITADKTVESYEKAAPEIDEFLRRFPADSRSETLLGYQREVELRNLERRFEQRAKGLAADDRLLPIERAYLDAMNYARLDPNRGLIKLQALVDLYCDRKDLSGPAGKCLELARRQLAELKTQSERLSADGKLEIESRLARAEELRPTDPAAANTILRSIIDVFGEKPWAAEMVAEARQALAAAEHPSPATKPPASKTAPPKPTTHD